jgi:hypothetical protein
MVDAVPGHRARRAGEHRDLVGPFLCPASRLPELAAELRADDHLELGVIVDTGLDSVDAVAMQAGRDSRLSLAMLEVPLPPLSDLTAGAAEADRRCPGDVRLFVELPRTPGWEAALDGLAAAGRGAKLRTGGLEADRFPTDAELTAFVSACVERAVPFKCTAGLHHAVRHTDPVTGFRHHGFLNILLATCAAVGGGDVQATVAEDRPEALAAAAEQVDAATAQIARRLFVSYGSCSIEEPVADLRQLGLL